MDDDDKTPLDEGFHTDTISATLDALSELSGRRLSAVTYCVERPPDYRRAPVIDAFVTMRQNAPKLATPLEYNSMDMKVENGRQMFLTKYKGWDAPEDNRWEPRSHYVGAESKRMMLDFAAARRKEKQAAAATASGSPAVGASGSKSKRKSPASGGGNGSGKSQKSQRAPDARDDGKQSQHIAIQLST